MWVNHPSSLPHIYPGVCPGCGACGTCGRITTPPYRMTRRWYYPPPSPPKVYSHIVQPQPGTVVYSSNS